MGSEKFNFEKIPGSVKSGVGLLLAGWLWLLYSVYYYYDKTFLMRFFIGGVVVFVCVLQFKKWARILALLCNTMTILYCAFFAAAFHMSGSDSQLVVASVINVLLFSSSSYFLLLKSSADFFRRSDSLKDNQS